MTRVSLLIIGLFSVSVQHFFFAASQNLQVILFLVGVVILGIPHGAADLLISRKDSIDNKKKFSFFNFFATYLGLLFIFLIVLIFLPFIGLLIFVTIASYHFGETDLYQFKTDSFLGSLFVISYGLIIINVILLNHINEIKPLLFLFGAGTSNLSIITFINHYRLLILSISATFFFFSTFFFFTFNSDDAQVSGQFLINLAVLVFIVNNLPLLLGFTFYFVLWHSLLSLKNIVSYLHNNAAFTFPVIFQQIGIYSLIAFAGIITFGLTGFMFSTNNALIFYTFITLAVLTAPHLQVMHTMYKNIRLNKPILP